MDEKTEELRDIFTSVTDEETVTEEQTETRGSITDDPSGDPSAVVGDLQEHADFETDLSTETYCDVARAFYDAADRWAGEEEVGDGESSGDSRTLDEAIAEAADVDAETARAARFDLHLYAEVDLDHTFDAERARDLLADADPAAVADELDADTDDVARFAAADAARTRSLRANHRFRDRFDELLADGDLTRHLTEAVTEDGLDEATEGMETDVSM